MELGPVLRFEMITTARRGRYYAARVVYGLFLLFTVWTAFSRRTGMFSNRELTAHDMVQFGQGVFSSLAWLQWIAVLVVVPAMTAGVIADAYRRKTLRDILSSGLSARGIVFGKLSARLGHVAALVAVGIPVVALIGLFGGLDPWIVLDVYAGTASIAFAVGGVSILASTLARRPREAIVAAYALELGWLILPPLFSTLLPHMIWPFPYLDYPNKLLVDTNPFRVASEMSSISSSRFFYAQNPAMLPWLKNVLWRTHVTVAIMVGMQTLLGLVCVGLAAFLIRKLRAGDREGMPARSWSDMLRSKKAKQKTPRIATRPKIGDDPMWWKEWYAAPRGGLAWVVSGPFTLLLGVLLACYLIEFARPALLETWNFQQTAFRSGRSELNEFSRTIVAWLIGIWLVTVASAASVGITSEREDDTWVSLTASLLTGREVIRAKMLGSLRGTRNLAFAILAVVAVGVLAGGIHPLGAFFAVSGMVAFGAFTAALGVWCSLRVTNSTRSLVTSVLLLILMNLWLMLIYAGYHALNDDWPKEETPWMAVLTIPFVQWFSLFSYPEVAAIVRGEMLSVGGSPKIYGYIFIFMATVGQASYVLGALALWISSVRSYERIVGRAFRPGVVYETRPNCEVLAQAIR